MGFGPGKYSGRIEQGSFKTGAQNQHRAHSHDHTPDRIKLAILEKVPFFKVGKIGWRSEVILLGLFL